MQLVPNTGDVEKMPVIQVVIDAVLTPTPHPMERKRRSIFKLSVAKNALDWQWLDRQVAPTQFQGTFFQGRGKPIEYPFPDDSKCLMLFVVRHQNLKPEILTEPDGVSPRKGYRVYPWFFNHEELGLCRINSFKSQFAKNLCIPGKHLTIEFAINPKWILKRLFSCSSSNLHHNHQVFQKGIVNLINHYKHFQKNNWSHDRGLDFMILKPLHRISGFINDDCNVLHLRQWQVFPRNKQHGRWIEIQWQSANRQVSSILSPDLIHRWVTAESNQQGLQFFVFFMKVLK